MRYEFAKQIPQLIEITNTQQLLQLQDRFAADSLYEVQKMAITNYWHFVNAYQPDSKLYQYAKNKLNDLLYSKSARIRCMSLSACVFDERTTPCFADQIVKLSEDSQHSIRYQAGLILVKFMKPADAVSTALSKLKLDSSRLVQSLFRPVTMPCLSSKQTIEGVEPGQLNQLVVQALELEKGIRSSALLAKQNPIVDNADPIKHI